MKKRLLSLTALAATLGYMPTAQAQSIAEDVAVPSLPQKAGNRAANVPDPIIGFAVGGEAGLSLRDNIFRTSRNEESDVVAIIAPGISFNGTHDKGRWRVAGQIEYGHFFSNSDSNYIDGDLKANGTWELREFWTADLMGRIRADHVPIGSFIDDPDTRADEPTLYRSYEAEPGITFDNQQQHVDARLKLRAFDYDETDRVGGLSPIINDDRDRMEYRGTLTVGQYIERATMLFLRGAYDVRSYDEQIDSTALIGRDSDGYEAVVGVRYDDRLGIMDGEFYVGYLSQSYDNAQLNTVDDVTVGGEASWLFHPAWLLDVDLNRTVEENTSTGVSGILRTRGKVGVTYFHNPQWQFGGMLRLTNYDFETNQTVAGTGGHRSDDVIDFGLLARYRVAPGYDIVGEYQHVDRDSNDASVEYSSNAVFIRVEAGY